MKFANIQLFYAISLIPKNLKDGLLLISYQYLRPHYTLGLLAFPGRKAFSLGRALKNKAEIEG